MATSRRAASVADYRRRAKRVLPRMVFDFIDGGGGTENTIAANRAALDARRLLCSGPMDVGTRSQATTLFGRSYAMPVIIGPTGLAGAAWPKGEVELARGAGRAGIPFVMSTASSCSQDEVAAAGDGAKWMQLYLFRDRSHSVRIVDKAERLGFEVLEVTVDNPVAGQRLRDVRNGFSVPMRWTPRKLASFVAHPAWTLRMARIGMPGMALLAEGFATKQKVATVAQLFHEQLDPSVDWDDIARVRDRWKKPLVVKGLLDPAQVRKALAIGADGIVISNHGGRQLDGAVATIDVLPEFVAEARGRLTVLIDSGFRSGSDIARALALGAHGVQIGRATLYALASGGADAVANCLETLREELDIAQAMMGVPTIADFHPGQLRAAGIAPTAPERVPAARLVHGAGSAA